jgi:fatty acid amide hydrolase
LSSGITNSSALDLLHLLAVRELTALQAVDYSIVAIEAQNPVLNAVVIPLFEQARAEAARLDNNRPFAESALPLRGLPVTVKEAIDVAGTPSSYGVEALLRRSIARDSPVVAALRGAGAIVVAKTNVSQAGWFNEADNPVYGKTVNPWLSERAVGGSSGGEGAAVAAGFVPIGVGTDSGGSVRSPAHCCGVHGLKPTSGRLSIAGTADEVLYPGLDWLDQPGVLARSVADLRLVFGVLVAPGSAALESAHPPLPLEDATPTRQRRLVVGIFDDDGAFTPAPAIRRAVQEAGSLLSESYEVLEFAPPEIELGLELYGSLFTADGGENLRRVLADSPLDARVELALAQLAEGQGGARTLFGHTELGTADYQSLLARCASYRRRFVEELDAAGIDILVCPPDGLPAVRHGASAQLSGDSQSYAAHVNLVGMPAGVVAASRVARGEDRGDAGTPATKDIVQEELRGSVGLPVAVQVVGRHWREDQVLEVMAHLENGFRGRSGYPTTPCAPAATR